MALTTHLKIAVVHKENPAGRAITKLLTAFDLEPDHQRHFIRPVSREEAETNTACTAYDLRASDAASNIPGSCLLLPPWPTLGICLLWILAHVGQVGKAQGAGHASPVSVGVGSGAKSSGNGTEATSQCRGLLNRRSFSLGNSSPFRFREGDTKASRSAKTSTCRAPPEQADRPSPPASPYGPYLRGCLPVGQNYSSGSALGRR